MVGDGGGWSEEVVKAAINQTTLTLTIFGGGEIREIIRNLRRQ